MCVCVCVCIYIYIYIYIYIQFIGKIKRRRWIEIELMRLLVEKQTNKRNKQNGHKLRKEQLETPVAGRPTRKKSRRQFSERTKKSVRRQ